MSDLLERDALLARLEADRSEGGRLVFVGGEAGVGKTALVHAFAGTVATRVLWGSCESLTTPTPLGPFVDIAGHVGGATAAALTGDADARAAARALLAELGEPAVVVLEDVHWADQATLDALRVLGRRIDSTEALVLATYRDDEVVGEHPLRIVLGELATAPGVTRVSVPRLTPDAVHALCEPHGADGGAVFDLTQGNAFYVTEILAAGGDVLPATVRDAVLARAASHVPAAARLLEVIALVPSRMELWLLETVAQDDLEHLDACLASGILVEDGDAVAFRHELARLALESSVPVHKRRTVHARLLEALADTPFGGPDASRLAHHAEQAGDSAAVLQHARAAAIAAAAAGAHREAAAQYARVLRHAESLPAAERADMLNAYAQEAQVIGHYVESADARQEAIELFGSLGDPHRQALALARLTIPFINLGRNAEAEEASRASIDLLESLPRSKELGTAYATQAYARMLARDNAEGVVWGEKAVVLAEAFGDSDTLAYGLNMIGTSYVMAGEIERGIEYLLQSLEVAGVAGIEFRISSALGMLGTGLGEMYELERSERYLREHIAFAEGHDIWPSYSRSWLALVDVYRGRWDAGTAGAQAVLAQAQEAISRISALIALGRVRARRGDPGVADVLDQALELSTSGGHLQRLGHVHGARAEAAWLVGDDERAGVEARAAYPLAVEKRHLWFAGELAYWQWKVGALDGWPRWIAEPYRLQLEGSCRLAADAWRALGCPYEAARALAESDEEEGLLEALAELERLGAAPAARAVRQRLRDLGAAVPRGPRQATQANPAGLTARELDVLRLVAAGRRNSEVAAELVVSTRTVDHHVSAILRKLEVRTRGEAAAAASELGLLDPR